MDPTRATSTARFLPAATAAARECGIGPLRHVLETGSTNADLADEARGGDAQACVLVADHQTAGRGRLDRRWDDDAGSGLLVSIRIPADRVVAQNAVRAVGAAARAAVDARCPASVQAKWPNDLVVVDGPAPGKLAGVLAEFVDGVSPCVVIGVGVNLTAVPAQPGATSLEECGGSSTRDELLAALIRGFAARGSDPAAVAEELRAHSATLGSRVRVELPGGDELIGRAAELTDAGELVVIDDTGIHHTVGTGDVVHLRPG